MRGEDVKNILEKNGHVLSVIAKQLDISPQNFNNWLGVQDIKTGILEKIAHAIDKNISYFIENQSINNQGSEGSNKGEIRYYEIDETTNLEEILTPSNELKYQRIFIPGYRDCCTAINVWGNSMNPVLTSGDIILCKEWKESFIEYGYMYLIFTKQNHRMIKYLQAGSDNDKIKCISKNKFFQPFEINRDEISKLFVIRGHIEQCAI